MNRLTITIFLLTTLANVCADELGEEIVVTGSRITSRYDMPNVTITKDADFIIQEIRLLNDSRSPTFRRREIIETINNMLIEAKKSDGIEIAYGQGFLAPVKVNDESIELLNERNREDSSYVDLFIKVALNKKVSTKDQTLRLRKFISGLNMISRTELLLDGDVGISMINPEQYRYEILKEISKENKITMKAIGKNCSILYLGLESRIQWGRTDTAALALYIGYQTEISCN